MGRMGGVGGGTTGTTEHGTAEPEGKKGLDANAGEDVYRGATFNLAHSFSQMLHLRPQNRFEEFDRMYLVGGGTHPGSGLPVIFESARISARLLLEDLGQAA
jgi:phytoene dehydrogenase-like protein